MKLTDLEPQFLRIKSLPPQDTIYEYVDNLNDAQGISFVCPVCYQKNNGFVGTHSMICWFENRGVPPDLTPGPGRWNPSGTGYSDLSFVGPGAASILQQGGCNAHFFIRSGNIEF